MGQPPQLRTARQILLSQTQTFVYNLVKRKGKRQDFQKMCRCECSGREGDLLSFGMKGGGGYVTFVCVSEHVYGLSMCGMSVFLCVTL